MKNRIFFAFALLALVLVACEKDENMVTYDGGTDPTLSASKSGTIPLSFVNKDQEALTLSWTNPNYKFNTGVSSQTVNYQIEIDTTGANFTNPLKKIIALTGDLSKTFTQGEFNDALLTGLELKPGMAHNVEIRVKSSLGTNAAVKYSNVLKFVVTPYAIPPKVTPPGNPAIGWTDGKLFIVGDATPGGWNNPVPVPSQQLTQITPTQYQITLPLIGGKSYLLLPVNGDWSVKYGFDGANNTNNPDGGDLKMGGGDLLAPAVSGNYKVEINFQTGKYKLTKL